MKLKTALSVGVLAFAGVFATAGHAATYDVVNNGPTQYVVSDFEGPATSDDDYLNMADDGLVTFQHLIVTPFLPGVPSLSADQLMSYTLSKSGSPTITFDLAAMGAKFSTLLTKGTWLMRVVNLDNSAPAASAGTTAVSAVPLPGAALLFGSGLLGFLGFSNRRKV